MRQLTSLDTQFLALESPRQPGHVAGLALYDPSTAPGGRLAWDEVRALLEERMHLLPVLRWKLAEVPFGLDYPYWVDDEGFDLDFHVRELALASPGDDRTLAEQVARLHARPLDRGRPLWEMYVITGLASGLTAVYTKIHHAVIDGISGAEITGLLLDLSPDGRPLPRPEEESASPQAAGRRPSEVEMVARGLAGLPRYPWRVLRSLPTAVPNLDESQFAALPVAARVGRIAGRVEGLLRGDGNRVVRPTTAAPKTTFNGRLSSHRRFAFARLPLDRVKAVRAAYGCTLNDVVVAMCAGSVRRWLLEHDELPREPLVAQVPVSVRTEEEVGTHGNRIVLLAVPLHTEMHDPAERLRVTSEALSVMEERHRAMPATLMQDVNHFIPPALFSRASRLTLSAATLTGGRPTWNLVISNVPGPQVPLYCAGARLVANYPVAVITDGIGLHITLTSYDGALDVGVLADREQMPDVWCVAEWLEEALGELEQAAPG